MVTQCRSRVAVQCGCQRLSVGRGLVVALLGAECTGKSTLAEAMVQALCARGEDAVHVNETLRVFCDRHGRTPYPQEQAAIAAEQSLRIVAAASEHAIVIADTSALMTAVYSEVVFGDMELYPDALAAQRACDLTLLCEPDLPWQADGLQRDGAKVRIRVHAALRAALMAARVRYSEIRGQGATRLELALAALGSMD